MATLAGARARWVTENPINSPGYELSQADYDARADDMQYIMLATMTQEEANAARLSLKKKYTQAKAITSSPVGTTAADVRTAVVQHRAILDGLLEVLKDAAIILSD